MSEDRDNFRDKLLDLDAQLMDAMNALRTSAREEHGNTIDTIVSEYRRATNALSALFTSAPDQCYKADGIGCCTRLALPPFVTFRGVAQYELMALATARSDGDDNDESCPYHRQDKGCTLGDLKPPVCISHYCDGALLQTEYHSGKVASMLGELLESSDPAREADKIVLYARRVARQLPIAKSIK